jgi:hypothetical protein
MHLYTLSLVSFAATGLLLALMLLLDSQFGPRYLPAGQSTAAFAVAPVASGMSVFARLVIGLFILIAAANLVCTILLCGLGPCPSDPTHYLLLSWLR